MVTDSPGGLDFVRAVYRVPARVGGRVVVDGEPGTITRGDRYLWVRFDGENRDVPCHPTWRVVYEERGDGD